MLNMHKALGSTSSIEKYVETVHWSLTDEWINKTSYIHTTEYYPVFKRNSGTCYNMMNLEGSTLIETRQPQKPKTNDKRFYLDEISKAVKSTAS